MCHGRVEIFSRPQFVIPRFETGGIRISLARGVEVRSILARGGSDLKLPPPLSSPRSDVSIHDQRVVRDSVDVRRSNAAPERCGPDVPGRKKEDWPDWTSAV